MSFPLCSAALLLSQPTSSERVSFLPPLRLAPATGTGGGIVPDSSAISSSFEGTSELQRARNGQLQNTKNTNERYAHSREIMYHDSRDREGRKVLRTCRVNGARERFQALCVRCFVSTSNFAKAFVSSGQEDDGNEGNQERNCTGDVPLGEDDAEVLGRPGKEHLECNGH